MFEDYKQHHRTQQGNSEREEGNLRITECKEMAAPAPPENEGRTEQEERKLWQNKLE